MSQADLALFEHIEKNLYTAVVSDSLDELGIRQQAMREYLRPVVPCKPFAGRARTLLCMDVYHIADDPYGKEIEAVDSLLPGEVAIVGTAQSKRNAPWGELLSTAAKARGARGAVIDGLVRDTRHIRALGFGVYAAGLKPVDSQGRGMVVDYNVPVECGEVLVHPGDLIFADEDGVIVIPAAHVDGVIVMATDRASRENHTRDELSHGAYLRDVYAKYGVL